MRYLIYFIVAAPLLAQDGIGCVKDMMVPSYTNVARRSPEGGDVHATVSIGWQGQLDELKIAKADENLAQEVRDFLSRAAYDAACQGKTVELVFTFKLEGKAEASPPVWVRFQAPNHFVIISRPRSLML